MRGLESEFERQRKINQIIEWVTEDDVIGEKVLAIVMEGLRRKAINWRTQAADMETLLAQESANYRGRGSAKAKETARKNKISKLRKHRSTLHYNWDAEIGTKEQEEAETKESIHG